MQKKVTDRCDKLQTAIEQLKSGGGGIAAQPGSDLAAVKADIAAVDRKVENMQSQMQQQMQQVMTMLKEVKAQRQ